jgi:hypothetical protein
VAFLGGELIKMCANIFYILIAVNRYGMLIGREHNPTLEKISKWEMNWVIGVSLASSCLLNIGGHIFQYFLNNGRQYLNVPFVGRRAGLIDHYLYAYDRYPLLNRFNATESVLISAYLLVYFLVSFLLFFALNTTVEIVCSCSSWTKSSPTRRSEWRA